LNINTYQSFDFCLFRPVSSSNSLKQAVSGVSPDSIKPPGKAHLFTPGFEIPFCYEYLTLSIFHHADCHRQRISIIYPTTLLTNQSFSTIYLPLTQMAFT